jgi:hypothetical protein
MNTMNEAVDLIRDLVETLARADQELAIPGSCRKHGWNIREEIDGVLAEAFEFLDIEDGNVDDDETAKAIAERALRNAKPK